jgi:hypothetical protein
MAEMSHWDDANMTEGLQWALVHMQD